ncbi:dynactin p62 [Dentipellis sp. KUC8613]|nr:dynactin p62 [Dentipellis sp. KUC8613]
MPPSVDYHCPCLSSSGAPPPPHLPSSSAQFHPLHELFFCEECDAVRCNLCVSVEVSGYYCPNCLFEVPSASVRAEKNRCARNCFLCPNCRNTLSVVPSDPPEVDDSRMSPAPISAVGEPPFFLYCNHCRWDSAEVDITFEKPTGLAAQLQKFEDSAPDSLEFERLKEHFEPFLRASSSSALPPSAAHSHHHVNPITAAASSALARDIPGVGKYTPYPRSRRDKGARDEMPEYRARVEVGGVSGGAGGDADTEFMQHIEGVGEVAALEQRWASSWATSLHTSDLKPLRIPLHSKKSKRCPTCRHILIKPEQKAQSVRYKIKLVAANYLPAITVALPHPADPLRRGAARSASTDDASGMNGLHAGKTYPFQLALTNPLYDPIQVRLNVQRQLPPAATAAAGPDAQDKSRRPPYAVTLPSTAFPIAAFAEAWEYEDDEDMFGEDGFGFEGRGAREKERAKSKTVGVLERRANVTIVGGEVVIGKDAKGEVKFNMMVSYTYRSDDPLPEDDVRTTPSRTKAPEMKTFSFYTVIQLGTIIPREERTEVDF